MAPEDPRDVSVPKSPSGRIPKWVTDEALNKGNVSRFEPPAPRPKAARQGKATGRPAAEPVYEGGRAYRLPRRTRLTVAALFFVVPMGVVVLVMLTR